MENRQSNNGKGEGGQDRTSGGNNSMGSINLVPLVCQFDSPLVKCYHKLNYKLPTHVHSFFFPSFHFSRMPLFAHLTTNTYVYSPYFITKCTWPNLNFECNILQFRFIPAFAYIHELATPIVHKFQFSSSVQLQREKISYTHKRPRK